MVKPKKIVNNDPRLSQATISSGEARIRARRISRRANRGQRRGERLAVDLAAPVRLPDCGVLYAQAIADPFGAPAGACIPTYIGPITQKFKSAVSGAFSTGDSVAFCMFRPSPADDIVSVSFSNSAYVDGTLPADATTGTGVTAVAMNTQFSDAQFFQSAGTAGLKYRLVSCALRVKPNMPSTTCNGNIVSCVDPEHASLEGYSYANLSKFLTARRDSAPAMRGWHTIKWTGITDDAELAFSADPDAPPYDWPIAFMSVGDANQSYIFEAVAHWEVIGRPARGSTPNEANPGVMAAVSNAIQKSNNSQASDTNVFIKMVESQFAGMMGIQPRYVRAGRQALNAAYNAFIG